MSETAARSSQTLEQRRAKHAWEAVQKAKKGSEAKKYAGEAKKLPARIHAAGLGQALAFIEAKSVKQLHNDLTLWVIKERSIRGKKQASLLENIIEGDADFLRRATEESLAWLQWLNRFVEAEGLTEDSDRT